MKLLAIDGNSILNRAFYGVRLLSNKKGVYTNAIFGFLNILLKLKKDYQPDTTAITFDLKAPTFRHLRYDGYKANRKGMPEELAMQLEPLKEILRALGYPLVELEGYEADDLLGTIAALCQKNGAECIIATGDRDSLQLVGDRVAVCMVKTKENILYDPQRLKEDYGVTPAEIIELKALMGDASDNIPGVKGIGEKTATALIQKYHSIDTIYQSLEEIEATPRVKKLLGEGKESAFLSRELATICVEAPMKEDLADLQMKSVQETELANCLTQLELFSFFPKFGIQPAMAQENTDAPDRTKQVKLLLDPTLEVLKEKLEQQGRIDFYREGETVYFCFADALAVCREQAENAVSELVFSSVLPKRTFQAKQFFKEARAMGTAFENLTFDVELAGYLLSAASRGYALAGLVQKYLPLQSCQVEAAGEEAEAFQTAAAFSDLCDVLERTLKEENMLDLLHEIELPLCEVLADMEYEGFAIDLEQVREYGDELQQRIDGLRDQLFIYAGHTFNPNSTKELGVILFDELGLPAKKKTKTGYSTNADVLESLRGKHPIIECLLEYRKLTKLHSTYIVGLLKVVGEDQRVHSTFNQAETRTGRISSTEPNVQNIPVRTEEGSKIREFFVAREGYTLVDADYSQIELRILAHIADDENMIRAFQDKVDIHQVTASQVFHVPLDEVTPQLRSRAKAINFGIVYGIGAFSLSQDIHVSVAEAKTYIDQYLKTYHGVRNYMDEIVRQAEETGYVSTLYHRRRDLADIRSTNKVVKANAKRIALNTPIQGTAADIIKIAMIRVFRRLKTEGLEAKLILQVHDELILESPVMQAPFVAQLLKEEMQSAAKLAVELSVDVHTGKNWLAAKG
ncbi:DNA polymerase I [Massilimaliae timonensis]|uniref:DNA polymerase I n=1 Tax=Massiliimalia timonensis TaxID=1987501 RepID=A0A8J6P2E9_9FIRM|nr:DNA polymerase I [Massiliimalia timonensis]MBC8611659.1 DNA polymerase I [Massiliimalia timonensis]